MTDHVDAGQAERVIAELSRMDAASQAHLTWLERLHKTLVCHLPLDEAELDMEAHHHCAFGRWYQGVDSPLVVRMPSFDEVGRLHARVHERARSILETFRDSGRVDEALYDAFMSDVTAFNQSLRVLQAELWQTLSRNDPLTGLKNRHGLTEEIEARCAGTAGDPPGTLCMMDLDHFKAVNDGYGHPVGDRILEQTAEHIRGRVRGDDLVYRYGGEEFVLFLTGCDTAAATRVCERLRQDIQENPAVLEDGREVTVTASFGVAQAAVDDSADMLVRRADAALYRAKELGRNRVVVDAPRAGEDLVAVGA